MNTAPKLPSADQLRLQMGELTPEEVRIAQAAYRLGAYEAAIAPPSGEGVDVDTWRAVEFLRQRLCNEEESWRNLCVVMSALTTPQHGDKP